MGGREGRIRILSLAGGSPRDVVVEGWSGFQSMDWAANGQGLYVSSYSAMHSSLLHIDLNGQATLLRQQMGSFETWGIPSPNGRHLAFQSSRLGRWQLFAVLFDGSAPTPLTRGQAESTSPSWSPRLP